MLFYSKFLSFTTTLLQSITQCKSFPLFLFKVYIVYDDFVSASPVDHPRKSFPLFYSKFLSFTTTLLQSDTQRKFLLLFLPFTAIESGSSPVNHQSITHVSLSPLFYSKFLSFTTTLLQSNTQRKFLLLFPPFTAIESGSSPVDHQSITHVSLSPLFYSKFLSFTTTLRQSNTQRKSLFLFLPFTTIESGSSPVDHAM